MRVIVLLGTNKGAFILESDERRQDWEIRGPFCEAWPINHIIGNAETGEIFAAGGHQWAGIGVWKSTDLGQSWDWSGDGLNYGENGEELATVWSLARANGKIYAGVQPAGLFESSDGGINWSHVEGLTNHPTRAQWNPGGAGLTLHHIVTDPDDAQKLWVGISSAGVFGTVDGGQTWSPRNRGTRQDFAPDEDRYPEFGQCVHSLTRTETGVLYQQNHCGTYRSNDGGGNWHSIEAGLPSTFGFGVAVHPRDEDTLWVMPMNGDSIGRYPPEGRAAVWKSVDGGQSWADKRNGLPDQHCYFTVLRQAMAVDRLETPGVYFGTNSGILYTSADGGENWQTAAQHLPLIFSVETMVLDG